MHLWNPYEHDGLKRRQAQLSEAGFKVMVGCLQFNRKSEFPLQAVLPILESIAKRMETERRD